MEVNPRVSRTVPFVAKATGNQIAKIAAKCMIGKKLIVKLYYPGILKKNLRKEAVFPFKKFKGVMQLGARDEIYWRGYGLDINFEELCKITNSHRHSPTF